MVTDRKAFRDAIARVEGQAGRGDQHMAEKREADRAAREALARESALKYRDVMVDLNRSSDRDIERALQGA